MARCKLLPIALLLVLHSALGDVGSNIFLSGEYKNSIDSHPIASEFEHSVSKNIFLDHAVFSRQAQPFTAPTYLPPKEYIKCGSGQQCVKRNVCSGGYFTNNPSGYIQNCEPETDVCCTYRPPPTTTTTTQRPSVPCSGDSDCVAPYQCSRGTINVSNYARRVSASRCYAPEVCCRLPATALTPDGYVLTVPQVPFPQPPTQQKYNPPAYIPPAAPAPPQYQPPAQPARPQYQPPAPPALPSRPLYQSPAIPAPPALPALPSRPLYQSPAPPVLPSRPLYQSPAPPSRPLYQSPAAPALPGLPQYRPPAPPAPPAFPTYIPPAPPAPPAYQPPAQPSLPVYQPAKPQSPQYIPPAPPAPPAYQPPAQPSIPAYQPAKPQSPQYIPPAPPAPPAYKPPVQPSIPAYQPAKPQSPQYIPPAPPAPSVYQPQRPQLPTYTPGIPPAPPAPPAPPSLPSQPSYQPSAQTTRPVYAPPAPPQPQPPRPQPPRVQPLRPQPAPTPNAYLPPHSRQPQPQPPRQPQQPQRPQQPQQPQQPLQPYQPQPYQPKQPYQPQPYQPQIPIGSPSNQVPIRGEGLLSEPIIPQRQPSGFQNNPSQFAPQKCSAALVCTDINYCTTLGTITDSPTNLTPQQSIFRAPLTDCEIEGSGAPGKCCRDTNYVDPWPVNPTGQCATRNRNTKPRGVTDEDTSFAEIPWQAMVLKESSKTLLCGGAIIGYAMVLTTASCLAGIPTKDVLVKAGEWQLGNDDEPLPFQLVRATEVEVHPGYDPASGQNNLAVILLEKNLQTAIHVSPICISDKDPSPSEKCIVTGWGKDALRIHQQGALLHQTPVELVSRSECGASSAQVCARSTYDACNVDYGSALACGTGTSYTLKGTFTSEDQCGNSVASFTKPDIKWINTAFNQNNRALRIG